MAKGVALFIFIALVFSVNTAHAVRLHHLEKPGSVEGFDGVKVDLSCDGVGEDECLMRRTLAAHIDYIYTQQTHD
ncbi:Phytosulfokine [Platanthera zijinensis]|uniref:Phytosulfokine n=1 Tax=Platanthera zijinensis TaxID=2320716 RepID=A0AAP0BJI1_9ASPA